MAGTFQFADHLENGSVATSAFVGTNFHHRNRDEFSVGM
jgi:hypothetical protein